MSPRRGQAALTASPVLVGAVTVLVTIVAVFLAYNANSGLPFVPTYDLKANMPNAAQLVKGFEVRIGGARVGFISKIEPKKRADGSAYAQVTMKLDKEIEPVPADSTLLVRPRSSLGLKYIELTPGEGRAGLPAGSTIPVRQARPAVVELDDLFSMFDDKTRVGSRNSLDGFGGGFAGRGQDINTAIEALVPLVTDLEPVARNLSDPDTRLNRFFASIARAAEEAAPVAEEQASLFVNLDTSFTAFASIARPFLQETISESPPSEQVAIREFPLQRPFIRNNTAFFRELRPGVAVLPHAAPILADAFEAGTEVLPKTKQTNEDLADVFEALADFSNDQNVRVGRAPAHPPVDLAAADAPLPQAHPDHLQLRDDLPPQRGEPALRGRRQRQLPAIPRRHGADRPAHLRAWPEQRGRAVRRARQRPRAPQPPAREPVPERGGAGTDAGVRGRQRALRCRSDGDRQHGW